MVEDRDRNIVTQIIRPLYRKYKIFYEKTIKYIPSNVVATMDYRLRPDLRRVGPFNGQKRRQELFDDFLNRLLFNAIIETGTFLGSTTEYLANRYGISIYTSEINKRYYAYSCLRLKKKRNVHIFNDDSRVFLRRCSDLLPHERILFYLDAHRYQDLPLSEEVSIISKFWSESVVIIDDFQVPDDSGYEYDDYGVGKKLCLGYLNGRLDGFEVFYPSARSNQETGGRRGSAILVTKDKMLKAAKTIRSIRQ